MRHIASKMHIGTLLRKTRRQSSPRLRCSDFASQNKEAILSSLEELGFCFAKQGGYYEF